MMENTTDLENETNRLYPEIDKVFKLQKQNQYNVAKTTSAQRINKLKLLRTAITHTYNTELKLAMYKELRKHETEVELNEITPVVGAINFAIRRLKRWMQDDPVPTPMSLFGFSHRIKYEPKGVVLIIAPWNFPINLSLMPLVSALAAGNTIILKPSENTPHSSVVLKKMINNLFDEGEIHVIIGGIQETTYLLKQPFNHIFFTGAPHVGKIVMKAAADNLASVSLELGGKSPTIIDETAQIEDAATRIAWSKCLNNGQICIAPDYVLIHQSRKNEFIKIYKEKVKQMYGSPADSESYGRIVNKRHFDRLRSYLDDAKEKGGNVLMGGQTDASQNYIEPTVIGALPDTALLWQEEIFGPILPIRTYSDIKEAIQFINSREKPLALYIYSKHKKRIKQIIDQTRSGAVAINYSAVHYVNPHLPFGGSNNSGIGKANGYYGFQAFSNAKGIQKHWSSPLNVLGLIYPPYTARKSKLAKLITKWFA
ncbi:MAG: aldehyde dehydrogenase (NAD+) [Saprospiraceae bacterium]|jgi:aldehyde dehydrogenase (NAD+)